MIKYAERQTFKNIISNEEINTGEIECNLKELIIKRQEAIKEKMSLSEEHLKNNIDNLDWLLKKIDNIEISDKIRDIIDDRECTLGYACYMQGLFDGIKEALIIKRKNFNAPI